MLSITRMQQWFRLLAALWLLSGGAAAQALHYALEVEGEPLAEPALWLEAEQLLLLPLQPIALALGNELEYDSRTETLWVVRSQDQALFSLRFSDGLVTANRRPVGYVPGIVHADKDRLHLPALAVETLTGTRVTREDGVVRVNLDRRLKPLTDFQLVLNGETLPFVEPSPRAVGHVLLIPLRPLVAELGNTLDVDTATQIVTVVRTQDNTEISLDLFSGLVKANRLAAGVVADMNYADTAQLLLPKAAVETLTGTHIELLEGTDQIHIRVDERLRQIVQPGAEILEEARRTPFTPQSLRFTLNSNTTSQFRFLSYQRQFNHELRYEVAELPHFDAPPAWLQWRGESLSGSGLSVGDYAVVRREVSGVGRLRGVTVYRPFARGVGVAVVGQPATGSRKSDRGATLQTFAGQAAGLRYYPRGRDWETGVSVRESADGARMASANWWRRWHAEKTWLGPAYYHADLEVGNSPADGGLAFNARWDARFRPHPRLSWSHRLDYTGLFAADDNGDSETSGADTLNLATQISYRLRSGLSLNARYAAARQGVGADTQKDILHSYGLGLSTPASTWLPGLQLGYSVADTEQGRNTHYDVGFSHDIHRFRFHGRYSRSETPTHNQSANVLNVSAPGYRFYRPLGGGFVSAVPNLNLNYHDGKLHGNLGANLSYTGKPWLEDKPRVAVNYGRYHGFSSDHGQADSARQFLTATAVYHFSPRLKLEARYQTSFQDRGEIFVLLNGVLDFNPPRPYTATLAGRGILSGNVFLDRNRDHRKQADEPGLPGVGIRLRGTRLGLRTNRYGMFTIQNLPAKTYDVTVLQDSLPFGLLPGHEELPRVLVKEGRISRVEVPVIASGQLRGRVYVDQNRNGVRDAGEAGLEGIRLTLGPPAAQTYSASFGQFAFERLAPGTYTLAVEAAFLPANLRAPAPVTVTLEADTLMQRVEVGVVEK